VLLIDRLVETAAFGWQKVVEGGVPSSSSSAQYRCGGSPSFCVAAVHLVVLDENAALYADEFREIEFFGV
jgi:hypothetical protein